MLFSASWFSFKRVGTFLRPTIGFLVLLWALEAEAVFLYSTAERNLDPPPLEQGYVAWSLQAKWGSFLATPISPTHFIAAKHVGVQSATLVFQDVSYPVDTSIYWDDPGSDLRIFRIQAGYSFPTFATLYCEAIDGSEIGKMLTVIGRGTPRGSPLYLDGNLKGWTWGSYDGKQSWGQSMVDGFAAYNFYSDTSLLGFVFAGDGVHDAALSVGDSSGGVFIYADNQWKLAGISYAVWPGLVSTTGNPNDPGVYAAIFDDARGLYQKNSQGQWVLISYSEPLPGVNFASRISDRLEWIRSVAPGVVVPEPATLLLMLFGGATWLVYLMLFRVRKQARRS